MHIVWTLECVRHSYLRLDVCLEALTGLNIHPVYIVWSVCVYSHHSPTAAGTVAREWGTCRYSSRHDRTGMRIHPGGKRWRGSRVIHPCSTLGGHMSQLHYGTSYLPVSAESTEEARLCGHSHKHICLYCTFRSRLGVICMTEVTTQGKCERRVQKWIEHNI